MIHSLAGGIVKDLQYNDFAKVKIVQDGMYFGSIFWYINPFKGLNEGDLVVVPVGVNNAKFKAEVLRVDKNVSIQTSPVPIKRCKSIIEIVKQ